MAPRGIRHMGNTQGTYLVEITTGESGSKMTTRYIPHLVYTLAITSLATHLLWKRKEAEDERAHYSARISLLEDTARRLRDGEAVSLRDFDLIRTLREDPGSGRGAARGIEPSGQIGWQQVLLGRQDAESSQRSEKWDAQDWEKVKHEVQRSS